MAAQKFSVYNINADEEIAIIQMDDELLRPEANIINHENFSLCVRNGSLYTLMPIEEPSVQVLKKVHDAYKNIVDKPFSTMFNIHERIDRLIYTLKLLFDKVEFIIIEKSEDLEDLINNNDTNLKKVTYNVLGDLYDKVVSSAASKSDIDKN